MNHRHRPPAALRAISLLEIVVTISFLGFIAAFAVSQTNRLSTGLKSVKLESDVATINQSIKVYLANGGILSDAVHSGIVGTPLEQKVIDKLKTRRNRSSAEAYVGLKSQMIDNRLAVAMQTAGEAGSNIPRAVWDEASSRFVIRTSGLGVREFYLENDFASHDYGIDEGRRPSVAEYNGEDGWIWAYEDSNEVVSTTPTSIPLGASAPQGDPDDPGAGGGSGGGGGGGGEGDDDEDPITLV